MQPRTQPAVRLGHTARRILASSIVIATALAASACGNDANNPLDLPVGQLRLVNAISDSNPIDATIANVPASIENIAFGDASGLKDVPEGSYTVRMTTTVNASQVEFSVASTPVDKDNITTVYAVGRMTDATQSGFAVETPITNVASDKSEVQFVNAASQPVTDLDIYLTAPDAVLSESSPISSLAFKATSPPTLVNQGSYRIRVTPLGNPTSVLFDSGPTGIALPAADGEQFALLDNTNVAFASPLSILILQRDGSDALIQHLGN
ncbi:MAG: DUF4397 domain-containing protein [Sinimarinibacterium sp.]|jgi:hypothetical protein